MKPQSLSLILLAFVAILSAVLVVPALGDSGTTVPERAPDVVAAAPIPSSSTTTAATTVSTMVVPTTTSTTTSTTTTSTTTTSTTTTTAAPVGGDTSTTVPPTTTTTAAPPVAATVKAPVTTTAPPTVPTMTIPTTTSTTTAPAPTTTTTTEPQHVAGFDSSAEARLVSLVNNLRASVGLPGLAHVGVLQSYSRSWSQHMAETGTFAHSNLYDIPGPWQSVAENVAVGTTAQSAFNALVASSGHYANMVNPTFTEIGSGVWADTSGKLWVTHVFRG